MNKAEANKREQIIDTIREVVFSDYGMDEMNNNDVDVDEMDSLLRELDKPRKPTIDVDDDEHVSRSQMQTYVDIQNSGLTNMFDLKAIYDLSDAHLDADTCKDIMNRYTYLCKLYDLE